jgi:hypothetical protein
MEQTEDTLDQIKALCKHLETLDAQIEEKTKELEELASKRRDTAERILPELFQDAGLSEITTDSGTKIVLSEFYVGNTKDPRSLDWLEANGFSDIIKNSFSINLKKGESDIAERIYAFLVENQIGFANKESIHHATLKSFINEQVEQNDNFPTDLFNVQAIRRVQTK